MTPERAERPKGLEGVAQPDRRARQRLEREWSSRMAMELYPKAWRLDILDSTQ
ncbi:uncharacterized protein AKAW2_70437S [Aspergillus luchuensis]|uniref:Aminotransferase, classes I and II n=1 Tax=Aspergillus kawachii TaxID=1069201 RepID=A0A146FEK9_ASPKA|nr:uncharacterized protein AKAW2_70437S [Aspergillus luchuensis]BCS03559.1 hypothetical protein AKAW2_70437S [Aspergillus luchuensis]BCS15184.1 hypothetical protein ALUC_70417S [Aspergillus luchuensis]GAT24297.1 aminotransferase, classes I and II [Aspergillus luchuensis]